MDKIFTRIETLKPGQLFTDRENKKIYMLIEFKTVYNRKNNYHATYLDLMTGEIKKIKKQTEIIFLNIKTKQNEKQSKKNKAG